MALTSIGKPFEGIVYYVVESSFGSGIEEESEKLPISNYVQSVRIGTGDKHAPIRGFDSPIVKALMSQTNEPELHIEYNPQCDDTLLAHTANRGSCCTLRSFTFVVGISTCTFDDSPTDVENASYFVLTGCKPGTIKIASTHNAPYTVTIDFLAKSIEALDYASAATEDYDATPSDLEGDILQFNVAGEISKTGGDYVITKAGGDRLAFITNSIDITIENQLTSYSDHDSLDKEYIVEGTLEVSGSVDITLDGGGASHINEVLNQTPFLIIVDMGGVGCPRIYLPACQWDNGEVTGDVGGEAVMGSCPFTSIPLNCKDSPPGEIIKSTPSEAV
jgi:hypothetical protein